MTGIRQNILVSNTARDNYLQGVVALDQEMSDIRVIDLANFVQANGIDLQFEGINQAVSTYDLFVFWHMVATAVSRPPGNAAHGASIFLPWHRMYLIRLEQELQRVLGDADFAMPYWDWAADGELDPSEQWRSELWSPAYLGEARGFVQSGTLAAMQVRLYQIPQTRRVSSAQPRSLWRRAGVIIDDLPNKSGEAGALGELDYDMNPWSVNSPMGLRNRLEGFIGGTNMHNRVHVWVNGDMLPMSSPNDPVFFLNHCNVDRIWETWMIDNGLEYRPGANEGPQGHRINSVMLDLFGGTMTPQDVLDPSQWYDYDTLLTV